MVILVVGDKSKVFESLTKLGYEVIELDAEGNVLKIEEATNSKETKDVKKPEPVYPPGKTPVKPRNESNPR